MTMLQFLFQCFKAYRVAKRQSRIVYFGVVSNGVPEVTVLVATDREAWRLSSIAVEGLKQ